MENVQVTKNELLIIFDAMRGSIANGDCVEGNIRFALYDTAGNFLVAQSYSPSVARDGFDSMVSS